jgi:hypothetical protein
LCGNVRVNPSSSHRKIAGAAANRGRDLASPGLLWHHARPWRAAWRICLNTSGAYISTLGRTEEILSRSTSSERTAPVRSAQKSIHGTVSSEPANPRTKRQRISKRNGKPRAFPRICILARPGRAGSNPKNLRRPSRPRPPNRRLPQEGRRLPRPRPLLRRLRLLLPFKATLNNLLRDRCFCSRSGLGRSLCA